MVRMKYEFDSTGDTDGVYTTFFLIAIFSFGIAIASIADYPNFSGIMFIIFLVSLLAVFITSVLRGGVIYAFEKKVVIIHKFFSRKVLVSHISYRDIEYAEYNVKAVYSRLGFVEYDIILTITKKTGSSVKVTSGLDIKENMPTDKPDKYKKYLNEHPIVKMCNFINEKAGDC